MNTPNQEKATQLIRDALMSMVPFPTKMKLSQASAVQGKHQPGKELDLEAKFCTNFTS